MSHRADDALGPRSDSAGMLSLMIVRMKVAIARGRANRGASPSAQMCGSRGRIDG